MLYARSSVRVAEVKVVRGVHSKRNTQMKFSTRLDGHKDLFAHRVKCKNTHVWYVMLQGVTLNDVDLTFFY